MAIARVSEIISASDKRFDDAIRSGIEHANETLENIEGAWIESQKLELRDGKIAEYRVVMKLSFVLNS